MLYGIWSTVPGRCTWLFLSTRVPFWRSIFGPLIFGNPLLITKEPGPNSQNRYGLNSYIYICIYRSAFTHSYTSYIYIYSYTYIYICVHRCVMYRCVSLVFVYIHIYVDIYIFRCIHVYTVACVRLYMQGHAHTWLLKAVVCIQNRTYAHVCTSYCLFRNAQTLKIISTVPNPFKYHIKSYL